MDGAVGKRASLLDSDTLSRLLRLLETTEVDELEIVDGESRVYVRRDPTRMAAGTPDTSTRSGDGVPIGAPLTGVYYARPSPDEQPFVSVGATIEQGQVVALIETMKLFNEVTTEFGGEIQSIVVQQGDLVEAGQPLMYVRAEATESGHE